METEKTNAPAVMGMSGGQSRRTGHKNSIDAEQNKANEETLQKLETMKSSTLN